MKVDFFLNCNILAATGIVAAVKDLTDITNEVYFSQVRTHSRKLSEKLAAGYSLCQYYLLQ